MSKLKEEERTRANAHGLFYGGNIQYTGHLGGSKHVPQDCAYTGIVSTRIRTYPSVTLSVLRRTVSVCVRL